MLWLACLGLVVLAWADPLPYKINRTSWIEITPTANISTPFCNASTSITAWCPPKKTPYQRKQVILHNALDVNYKLSDLRFNLYGFSTKVSGIALWALSIDDQSGGTWQYALSLNPCPQDPQERFSSWPVIKRKSDILAYQTDYKVQLKTNGDLEGTCLTRVEVLLEGILVNPDIFSVIPNVVLRGSRRTSTINIYAHYWERRSWVCLWMPHPYTKPFPPINGVINDEDPRILICSIPQEAFSNYTEGFTLSVLEDTAERSPYIAYNFTIFDPPTILSVTPASGPLTGNTRVTISGSGFVASNSVSLFFGSLPASHVEVVDANTITCRTPPLNDTYINGTTSISTVIQLSLDGEAWYSNDGVIFKFDPAKIPPDPPPAPDTVLEWIKKHIYVPVIVGIFLFVASIALFVITKRKQDDAYMELKQVASDLDMSSKLVIKAVDLSLKKRIGRGQYADVHLATWKYTEVAVKKLRHMEDDVVEDLMQEAKVMLQLRHPNVVAFLGVSSIDGDLCLITEYMARGSLRDIITKPNIYVLEAEHKKQICLHTANGMDYLHSQNLIHRDLKSANLLVNRNWEIKVSDFGLSKFLEEQKTNHTLTSCGTPYFAAPEVLKKAKYSFKADIYSFGMVLYEVWVSPDLFEGNPYKVLAEIIKKHRRPSLPTSLDPVLSGLMRDCWKAKASERPSFRDAVSILNTLLLDSPENEFPLVNAESEASSGHSKE